MLPADDEIEAARAFACRNALGTPKHGTKIGFSLACRLPCSSFCCLHLFGRLSSSPCRQECLQSYCWSLDVSAGLLCRVACGVDLLPETTANPDARMYQVRITRKCLAGLKSMLRSAAFTACRYYTRPLMIDRGPASTQAAQSQAVRHCARRSTASC